MPGWRAMPTRPILRWIFRCVAGGHDRRARGRPRQHAGLDRATRSRRDASRDQGDSPTLNLPSLVPSIPSPLLPGGDKRLMPLPQPDGAMAKPMTFELVGGGKLMATGTITPGISRSFAAEVGKTRRLHQDRGAEFAGRFGDRRARHGPADSRAEIRNRGRGGKILRLILSAGVRRRRRAPRRRQRPSIGVHQVAAMPSAANRAAR